METTLVTVKEQRDYQMDEYVPFEEVKVSSPSVNFLEANTSAITIEELSTKCVVPTWANQELTISHQDFINTIHDAACNIVYW